MDQQFHIYSDGNSIGPFDIRNLKEHGIKPDTFVWASGMPQWTKATEVPELQGLFSAEPPKFIPPTDAARPTSSAERVGYSIGKRISLWLIVLLVCGGGYMIYANNSEYEREAIQATDDVAAKSPEQLRTELAAREAQAPSKYLVAESTMRGNLIGQKVIEGTVTNRASIASFKDAVVRVRFYSKTGTALGYKDFTIYEILSPASSKRFKFKVFAPDETKGFDTEVIRAASIN